MNSQSIDPRYLEPHYSTKLWRVIKTYCDHFYGKDLFEDVSSELNMPVDFLLEDDNWVSNYFGSQFFDKLKKATNEKDLFKNIGKFFIDKENINMIEYTLVKSLPPFLFFNAFPMNYGKANQINDIRCLKRSPGHFSFQISPKSKKAIAHADVCANTLGILQSAKDLYGLDDLVVNETSCLHRGAENCTFDVSYKAFGFWRKRLANLAVFPLAAWISWIVLKNSGILENRIGVLTLYSLFCVVAVGFAYYFKKFYSLVTYNKFYYEQSRKKNTALYDSRKKLDRRYRESSLLRRLSTQLISTNVPQEVIKLCLSELEKNFGYERSLVMLLSGDQTRLYTAEVNGFQTETSSIYKLSFAYPGRPDNPQVFANILSSGKYVLIDDIQKFKNNLKPENQKLLEAFEVKSLVVAPLQYNSEKYGLMIVGSLGDDRPMAQEDLHLIEEISRLFSISFQNARNYEREQTLKSIFQKYVPREVIESVDMLGSTKKGHIEPRTTETTSIFIDLRGFSTTSENFSPEKIMDMLNLYITFVSQRIAHWGGIVDNLIGDGIVIFFSEGKDKSLPHSDRAFIAALQIMNDLDILNSEYTKKGYPKARLGIGINTGNSTVGNLGSDIKMNFTSIGDTVNVAARLQDLSKKYMLEIKDAEKACAIVSGSTMKKGQIERLIGGAGVIPKDLGQSEVRGRSKKEQIFLFDLNMARQVIAHIEKENSKIKTA